MSGDLIPGIEFSVKVIIRLPRHRAVVYPPNAERSVLPKALQRKGGFNLEGNKQPSEPSV